MFSHLFSSHIKAITFFFRCAHACVRHAVGVRADHSRMWINVNTAIYWMCPVFCKCEPVSPERCQSSATCLAPVYRHCLAGDHVYITLHCLHLSPNLIITIAVLDIYSAATWKAFMSSLLYSKALCSREIETTKSFSVFSICSVKYVLFPFYSRLCCCFRCVCQKPLWGSVLVKRAERFHKGIWNATCVASNLLHRLVANWLGQQFHLSPPRDIKSHLNYNIDIIRCK